MGITVGQTWSRTSTVTYNAAKVYKYTLWAANVKDIEYWAYNGTRGTTFAPKRTLITHE